MDFSFFTSITQDYVDSYEEEILDDLEIEDSPVDSSDTDWDPASSPVRNLPADANLITRDIVVVDLEDINDYIFNLDDPDFYSFQDLRHFVSDPRVCSNQVIIPRLCSVLRQARKEDIVVVGIFPAARGMVQKAWFVVEVKEYQEDTKTRKWNVGSRSWNAPEYYENVGSEPGPELDGV
ncbi:hypothetical protein MPER_06231 [Moniliophthora perniciosa FA553]|nr:hypothetical protein MPER_06231 [Moniliophthora perniciosa FA553]